MNALSTRMLAEGYDRFHHPEFVKWVDVGLDSGEFEYTREFLKNSSWQTPCGIYKKLEDILETTGWLGIDYCPENNNYLTRCVTPEKEAGCPHALHFPTGIECPMHLAEKYVYENSAECLEKQYQQIMGASLEALQAKNPYIRGCACRHFDRISHEAYIHYDPARCIAHGGAGCTMETCAATGKPRNISRGNIYYDVRISEKMQGGVPGMDRCQGHQGYPSVPQLAAYISIGGMAAIVPSPDPRAGGVSQAQ